MKKVDKFKRMNHKCENHRFITLYQPYDWFLFTKKCIEVLYTIIIAKKKGKDIFTASKDQKQKARDVKIFLKFVIQV